MLVRGCVGGLGEMGQTVRGLDEKLRGYGVKDLGGPSSLMARVKSERDWR